jgi:hypothetical protein
MRPLFCIRYMSLEIPTQIKAQYNTERCTVNCTYPVRTVQQTHSVSVIKTNQLMLYREIIVVCSQIYTKHINTLCGLSLQYFAC